MSITTDSDLSLAVKALGRYFSVVSKEKFLALLANTDDMGQFGTYEVDASPQEEREAERIARLYTDITESAVTQFDICKYVSALFHKSTSAGDEAMAEMIMRILTDVFMFVGENDAQLDDDGTFGLSQVSLKSLLNVKGEANDINTNFAQPSKTAPNLTATAIYPVNLTYTARDTGAVALFLNSIPTLEFSRSQPYLNITVINNKPARSEDGRIQSMGQMQFLFGQQYTADDSPNSYLTDAAEVDAINMALLEQSARTTTEEEQATAENNVDPKISTAGMELFTSPQTLVNAFESHSDIDPYVSIPVNSEEEEDDGYISVGGTRAAPVIDKFRPFMSLESFKVSVAPSKGLMSFKTAELGLVLHDRSRLSEIGELVKPDLYGDTELMVTYGWSHPEATGEISGMSSGQDGGVNVRGNFFGTLIDAMKVTEKYKVVNSTYQFDDVGGVKITLKLAMKGAAMTNTVNIAQGEGSESTIKTVNSLVKAVKRVKENLTGTGAEAKDILGQTFVANASDTSTVTAVSDKLSKEVAKFLQNGTKVDSHPDVAQLKTQLLALYGKDGKGGAVKKLRDNLATSVNKKVARLQQIANATLQDETNSSLLGDPFPRLFTGAGGSKKYVNINTFLGKEGRKNQEYVSLGLLFLMFAGKPLAASQQFDEVQFVFYAFNDKASYVKDANVAEFPIHLPTFQRRFSKFVGDTSNVSIGKFLSFINEAFVNTQAARVYGLRGKKGIYKWDADEPSGVTQRDLKPDQLLNRKMLRLKDAYGDGEDLEFKMPKLQMYMTTHPRRKDGENKSAAGSILRIHVFDSRASKYASLGRLIQATRSDSIGMISSAISKTANPPSRDAKNPQKANGVADHQKNFVETLQKALDSNIIEPAPNVDGKFEAADIVADPQKFSKTYFRMKGGFPQLKEFIMRSMPSIIYGSNNSSVMNASVSSLNNSQLATINMLKSGMEGGITPQGARDSGLPLNVHPVQLSMNMIGCPIIDYAQHFFVDFGTGTTVDNVYVVSKLTHTIEAGKFETNCEFKQINAYGHYQSLFDTIEKTIASLVEAEGLPPIKKRKKKKKTVRQITMENNARILEETGGASGAIFLPGGTQLGNLMVIGVGDDFL